MDPFNDTEEYEEIEDPEYENNNLCQFPGNCCMPGWHFASECHTPAMAEAWMREAHGRSLNPGLKLGFSLIAIH